jgi:selenocysteine lyase/cysteine desulfurase
VRISPHYYNTREEVDVLVDAIEGLLREGRS